MNNTNTSFFIASCESSLSPSQAGARAYPFILTAALKQNDASIEASLLIRAAEILYSRRDYAELKQVALLLAATEQGQGAGLYYLALLESIDCNTEVARSMLEPLIRYAPPVFRARAQLTFATTHHRDGDRVEAARGYFEAARYALRADFPAACTSLFQASLVKSEQGNHQGALDDLVAAWPLVRLAVRTHPHLFYQFHNEIAFELACVSRFDEAREHSAIACRSPLIFVYPEFKQTVRDIEDRVEARAAAPVRVAISRCEPEQKAAAPPVIVVRFDIAPRPRNRQSAFKPPRVRAPICGSALDKVKYSIWPLAPPPASRIRAHSIFCSS